MSSQVSSKWRVGAIVLALIMAGQGLRIYRMNAEIRNIFYFDVEVTLTDGVTGEVLEYGTTHGPGMSTADLIPQSTTYGGGVKTRRISGVGYEPRRFGFSAKGYKRKNVLVTEDTKSKLTVSLDPI